MDRALEADPGNLEVLLSLGVSHTNELDAAEALSYLHRWITAHPTHGPAAAAAPGPPDSSQRHAYVVSQGQGQGHICCAGCGATAHHSPIVAPAMCQLEATEPRRVISKRLRTARYVLRSLRERCRHVWLWSTLH